MRVFSLASIPLALAFVLALGCAAFAAAGEPGITYHVTKQTLPDIPKELQFKTVREAAELVAPGDTVLIHSGVYRESVSIASSGTKLRPITFSAAPGAIVVITGLDSVRRWTKADKASKEPIYYTPWDRRFIAWNEAQTHPDDAFHQTIGRCEQVVYDGYLLRQVLERPRISSGTFYVDGGEKRLYVWAPDNSDLSKDSTTMEAATRQLLWDCQGDYVVTRGIRFAYAANMAQHGAALFGGQGDVVEDCIFERMNSVGASFEASDLTVRRCVFRDNGQLGFAAKYADRLLFTGCTVSNNNVKGWQRGWEAGGNKLVFCRDVVLEKSRFIDNRGCGIWFDISNDNCTVRNNLIAGNEDAGIFYEISYGLKAHDNVIVGNGLTENSGGWGAQGGICLSSSPGCVVERNLLVSNKEGFCFREQTRTTPALGATPGEEGPEVAVWNHDEAIRNNVIAYNRDAQTWGWFDVGDERFWPVAMQKNKAAATSSSGGGQAQAQPQAQPIGLSLEKLRLTMTGNIYALDGKTGLFNWGTSWGSSKKYTALDAVQKQLGLEQGSVVLPVTFADTVSMDFRVHADSPAVSMGCYPQGEVPGVILGILK